MEVGGGEEIWELPEGETGSSKGSVSGELSSLLVSEPGILHLLSSRLVSSLLLESFILTLTIFTRHKRRFSHIKCALDKTALTSTLRALIDLKHEVNECLLKVRLEVTLNKVRVVVERGYITYLLFAEFQCYFHWLLVRSHTVWVSGSLAPMADQGGGTPGESRGETGDESCGRRDSRGRPNTSLVYGSQEQFEI